MYEQNVNVCKLYIALLKSLKVQINKRHSTDTHEVCNSLSKAHSVHGHSYSIGKGKDQADGPTQLWAEAATDQEVGPT